MNNNPITTNLLNNANQQASMSNPAGVQGILGAAKNYASQNNLQQFSPGQGAGGTAQQASKALPVIGNIAGGIGGGVLGGFLAGEAIDPLGGGLVGAAIPLLSGIFGAGIGQAAGKAGENVIQGKPVTSQLGQNLGEGALSQLAGEGIGKGLSFIGKPIASGINKLGSNLLQKSVAGSAGNVFTKEDANTLYNYGINNAQDFVNNIHPKVSGPTGALTNTVERTLQQADKQGQYVNLTQLERTSKGVNGQLVKEATNNAGLDDATAGQNNVQNIVSALLKKFNPNEVTSNSRSGLSYVNQTALAKHGLSDALNITRALDSKAADFMASSNLDKQQQGEALRYISNTIKDTFDGLQVGNQAIPDALRQQGLKELEAIRTTAPQYYNAAKQALEDPNASISSLRSFGKSGTRASVAFQDAARRTNMKPGLSPLDLVGGGIGFGMGSLPGALAGAAVSQGVKAGLESAPVQTAGVKIAQKLGGVGAKAPTNALTTALSKLPAGYPKALTGLTALGGNVSNLSQPITGGTQGANMNQGQGAGAGAPTTPATPTAGGDINQSLATPIALMQLAAMTDPYIFQQMGGASTLQGLLKPITAAQTAAQGLQSLYGSALGGTSGVQDLTATGGLSPYQQAGGGQGALSGGLSGVLSRLFGGGETSRFAQQQAAEQKAINDALEAAGVKTQVSLPGITSTPQAAKAQYDYALSLLNSIGGGLPNAAGGGIIPQSVLQSIPAAQ